MTLNGLVLSIRTSFADSGEWFTDLFCKIGLGKDCSVSNWMELTIGQASLIVIVVGALVFNFVSKRTPSQVIASVIAIVVGFVTLFSEIIIAGHVSFRLDDYVPFFPIGLAWVICCMFLPIIVGTVVHTFVLSRIDPDAAKSQHS